MNTHHGVLFWGQIKRKRLQQADFRIEGAESPVDVQKPAETVIIITCAASFRSIHSYSKPLRQKRQSLGIRYRQG